MENGMAALPHAKVWELFLLLSFLSPSSDWFVPFLLLLLFFLLATSSSNNLTTYNFKIMFIYGCYFYDDHEVLWVKLRPKRLPRGFSSLIAGVVYHPHWTATENDCMRDHLFQSLLLAESRFPNCALIVGGDFNRQDVKSIQRHFRLRQIVKSQPGKISILDLVLTNMHGFCADPQQFPPFGLSDHHTVTWRLKKEQSPVKPQNLY